MEGPGVRRGQRGTGKARWRQRLRSPSFPLSRLAQKFSVLTAPSPSGFDPVALAECACTCAPHTGAPSRCARCPQQWLRVGAGRSCCAVPRRPGLGLLPASVLAQMCWHRCQGGPLSGLLQATMEKAGPRAERPRHWPRTRGAPFDVSGGQVTLTFSSYAAVSVI